SERAATTAELRRRAEECRIEVAPDPARGRVDLAGAYEGRVVTLPPIRGLVTTWVAYEGPATGKFAIVAPVPLPLGGIAGFDFCDTMRVYETRPVETRGDGLMYAALRLRRGLDLQADYPTASAVIREKNLLLTSSSSRYVEVLTEDADALSTWLRENAQAAPWLDAPRRIIALPDRVFVPTR
ncbi:MAG: hypothetical protein AAGI51_17680, partial [Pseudomonadota bacterium]